MLFFFSVQFISPTEYRLALHFFSARIKRVRIYQSAWCVCLARASGYLPPERGVVPHPERGLSQHPERGVPPNPERGVPVHPERGLLLHPARDLSPAAAPQNRFTVRASFLAGFADGKTRSERQIHSICQIPVLPFAINRKSFCRKSNFAAAFKRV